MRAFSDGLLEGFRRPYRPSFGVAGPMSPGRFSAPGTPQGGGSSTPLSLNSARSGSSSNSTSTGGQSPGMAITDFIYFMLAEEDKTSEAAIRFW